MKRALIAALMLSAAALPARADELTDLVDKYVAWRGGAAYEQMQSIHQKGQMEIAGLKGPVESWSDRTGRSRSTADFGVVKALDVTTPEGGFSLNQSGQLEKASPVQRERARRNLLLEFGDALHGRGGAKLQLLGTESRDGQDWRVIRVTFGDGDVYDAFLDPRTGELGGVRVQENRVKRFDRYKDWRVVEGVRMPFLIESDSELEGSDAVTRMTEIDLNPPLDTALFTPPAPTRKAVFAPGKRSTGWIDFEFFGGNRIYFPARINGVETVVLLDSGAESTVLDNRFADKIGLKSQGQVTAMGTGGTSTAGLVSGVSIEVGALTLKDLTVATIDLAAIEKQLGHPLPVILGKEVFNQLVIDIDFVNHKIAFHDPEGFVRPSGAAEVPITLVDGLRAVPVSIEGRPPELFDFDIGNGSPLIVFPAYEERVQLLKGRPTSTSLGGAVGGMREQRMATIRSLTFAGTTFTDVPAAFPPAGPSGVDSTHTLGNLGLPILSRFRLTTDYVNDKLYLIPNPAAVKAPFYKDRLGVNLTRAADGFTVLFVPAGGPGEAAGFKKGEKIRLIDGKPVEAWPAEALRGLRDKPVGTVIEFTMEDGQVRRVKMADYF
jgi:hypothetical protein